MKTRPELLLKLLGSVGAPLMASIADVQARGAAGPADDRQTAETMASLLDKTVTASNDLIASLFPGEDAANDPLRIAAAGILAPLVSAAYARSGNIPGPQDIKALTSGLESISAVSGAFTGAPTELSDTLRVAVETFSAFAPVAKGAAEQDRNGLPDIARRLNDRAQAVCTTLGLDKADGKAAAQLAILKICAEIYASCRIDGAAQEEIWARFETRIAMLEAFAGALLNTPPDSGSGSGSALQPSVMPQAVAPPAVAAAPPPAGGSPLSMFAKPKQDGEAPVAAAPVSPPPPPVETPVAAAPPPPAVPPQNSPEPAEKPAGASPMAFFTKPKSGEE